MTAKLPPLPPMFYVIYNRMVDAGLHQEAKALADVTDSRAKQAVRDALEQAARTLRPELRSMVSRSDAAAAIRALLKEYSDDRS